MYLTITHRDGPARTGTFTHHDTTITTPNIIHLHSHDTPAPSFAPLVITTDTTILTQPTIHLPPTLFSPHPQPHSYLLYPKDLPPTFHQETLQRNPPNPDLQLLPPHPDLLTKLPTTTPGPLYIITNAFQLARHQTAFIDYLVKARQTLDPEAILYLPAIGTPVNLAILTYAGVDLIDTTQAILAAHHHTLLFTTGPIPQQELQELPCHCPTCTHANNDPTKLSTHDILTHNTHTLHREAQHIRTAIQRGTLREHLETRIRADPQATAYLRILDHNHPAFLETHTPITRKHPLLATTHEALHRPEITRYQHRIHHRYHKPPSAKILLLLPCSAHKPYSESKSHGLFRAQLLASPNPWVVHELIITSPLGLVPRELEIVPPACCYDITVTGHWSNDETTMIQNLLRHYLTTNFYDHVLVHLDPQLREIVTPVVPQATSTCVDMPTSDASLDRLAQVLHELTAQYPKVSSMERAREEVSAVVAYQFGVPIATAFMESATIRGRYPYRKIFDGREQLGMITEPRGLLSLTLAGAQACRREPGYSVTIADDFTLIGSVFAPGIIQADDDIRIGDDVWIVQKGAVAAVGVATMSGPEMQRARHGEAVKVRHRRT